MAAFSAVSLFAGCGGSDLGLRHAGIEPIWANEISESACDLHEDVVGQGIIEHADIRSIDRFPHADILAGCYPCQGYSQGGRRDSSDQVNYLYQEFDRALRQIKPLAFIVENVNGMRFGRNRCLLNNQLVRFRSAGYRVTFAELDAKDYGLPQTRRRLIIVGIRAKERKTFVFPDATHGPRTGRRYTTLRDAIWSLRNTAGSTYNTEPLHWYYLSRNRRADWDSQSPCIVANWRHLPLHPDSPRLNKVRADKWEFAEPGEARRLGYLEAAVIQGFPDPFAFASCSIPLRIRAIGNAVPPPLFGKIAKRLVHTLNSKRRP